MIAKHNGKRGGKVRNIVTIKKIRASRANFSVSLVVNKKQVRETEITGQEGEAIAEAIHMISNSVGNGIIIADEYIMNLVPFEFGGKK